MTRKKFVKQLMSLGLDRNRAADCARATRQRHHESYAEGLECFLIILAAVENTCTMIRNFEFTASSIECEVVPL